MKLPDNMKLLLDRVIQDAGGMITPVLDSSKTSIL